MEKKIQEQIKNLDIKIEWAEQALETAVKDFKDAAAKYDAYNIDEFIDGYVRRVREERRNLTQLQEQRRMLMWLTESTEG